MEIGEIARQNTQNELVAAQEKSGFSFNFNCFSQRKAGKDYIFRYMSRPSVKTSKVKYTIDVYIYEYTYKALRS
jgi:hypothetical protein